MAANPDQNPLFRKAIQPWYDTDIACILAAIFLFLVFGFALVGVSVAFEMPGNARHVWVPCILLVLSAVGIVTIFLRLFRRHAPKFKKELP